MSSSGSRTFYIEPMTVWTDRTVTGMFFPATPAQFAAAIEQVRGTWEMMGETGDIDVAVGYQIANEDDEDAWDTATAVGSYVSADGMTYAASFTDLSASLTKRLVRFGFLANNGTAGSNQMARVKMELEIREF